jgi:hypothetical protein
MGRRVKNKVTEELVQASARQLRRMRMSPARARELAPDVERLNNVALAAAEESDFNDEPARFAEVLLRLKPAGVRR